MPLGNERVATLAMLLAAVSVSGVMGDAPATTRPAVIEAEHPFMLWTPEQAKLLRDKITTDDQARAGYQRLLGETGRGQTLRNLFRFQVMGDEKAGEQERKYLLRMIGYQIANSASLDHGGRHFTCYLDALRYDVLYHTLTEDQRAGLQRTFRSFIDHQLSDRKRYTRTSWLPNMQWPRVMNAHFAALVLRDRDALLQLMNSEGGWKWYFDEYMTPEGFYMEEFGKHYSMMGEMLLFCRGLENAGLSEWGYGCRGRGGGTMRKYLESILMAGYPRVEMPGGLPHYGKMTMGDARGGGFAGAPPYVFQHSIVAGFLANGSGSLERYMSANMNGRDHTGAKVDKLLAPLWFEIAHSQWPDAGFDYFLAQMRRPGQTIYEPSMLFLTAPISPTSVKAPAAYSWSSSDRGLALLRAQSGSTYWESPAPAVSLQFASYYVHYTHDAMSLLGMVAFNRPIYLNRQISDGYAGNDPWTDSVRGHSGVIVDNLQAKPVDSNDEGAANQLIRSHFSEGMQAVSVAAHGVYPAVTQQRAGPDVLASVSLGNESERLVFRDFAHIRRAGNLVTVSGVVDSFVIRAGANVKVTVNGQAVDVLPAGDGVVRWTRDGT